MASSEDEEGDAVAIEEQVARLIQNDELPHGERDRQPVFVAFTSNQLKMTMSERSCREPDSITFKRMHTYASSRMS
eukprot:7202799-Heterocapsa_arctica.AAC.1